MKTFNVKVTARVTATIQVRASSAKAAELLAESANLTMAELQSPVCHRRPDVVWQGETSEAVPVRVLPAKQAALRRTLVRWSEGRPRSLDLRRRVVAPMLLTGRRR